MNADQRGRASMIAARLGERAVDEFELELVDELLEVCAGRNRLCKPRKRILGRRRDRFRSSVGFVSVDSDRVVNRRQGRSLS